MAEFYDCPHEILNDELLLVEMFKQAVELCGATLLQIASHKFEPQGVTIVALLSESHISIHTWPELGSAALDVFTCGISKPELALLHCVDVMKPQNYTMKCFDR